MKAILNDLLTMLYQYSGISIICTVLFMLVKKQAESGDGWKAIWVKITEIFKSKKERRQFIFVLYIVFVLQRTLFNRGPWGNPLENVIGNWALYSEGELNYEVIENAIMFLPLIPLFCIADIKIEKMRKNKFVAYFAIPLVFSFSIEMLQLLLRIGTFQLSDLFFNTLGGVAGGLIYWIIYKIYKFRKEKR